MAQKIDTIAIERETIGHLLKEGGLEVPLSQRSYRWEKEHVEELLKDIHGALENDAEHFIGSVVGIAAGDKGVLVYDGQQRLATSMILIAAIRDYFSSVDPETAQLIESESLISTDRETHKRTAHLRLNAEDNDFFFNSVLLRPDESERKDAVPQRESHKRIESACKFAAEFVANQMKSLDAIHGGKYLHKWLNFIQNKLRVIFVQVHDERTAFTIFETMNDRGLRLSAADLLKNHLYSLGDSRRNEIVQKWQSMCGVLETIEGESENVVEYVRCYWVTQHGHTRTKDLYDEIKRLTTTTTKAVRLASDISDASQDYAAILMSSHEKLAGRGGVRPKIETLRLLGVTQIRPVLLAALRKFSIPEFEKLTAACVTWTVRTLLTGVRSGTLEGYYSQIAHDITKGAKNNISAVAKFMSRIVPDDAQFQTFVATAIVHKSTLARYYLQALQKCADGEVEPQYIPNPAPDITLEHILPKDAGSGWAHFSVDEKKLFVYRLGNQALLQNTVNGKIGNQPYAVKEPELAKSAYSLTKDASGHAQWGTHEITDRQNRLAKLAVKTWPL